jgi:hypothetical protein
MNRRTFLASTLALPLAGPAQIRVSGYTKEPHGYETEIVDAGDWYRYMAGEGPRPLKNITTWVIWEEA